MSRIFLLPTTVALAVFLAGCAPQPSPTPETQDAPPASNQQEQGGEYEAAMAKLSPSDRALAEEQEICPVSGEPLGSMGTPYKVTVEGREVFLCCSGCEAEIKNNPEEYLAKLDS